MQASKIIESVRWFLPSPFSIALLLTVFTFLFAFFLTNEQGSVTYAFDLLNYWQSGFWGFLQFSMQMMLILVLGHCLAKTPLFEKIIQWILPICTSNGRAAALVCFFALFMAYINWGLGLIFGAILARRVAEFAQKKNFPINYPLIAAASYTGLMVWHGGFSGSAPLALTDSGHKLMSLTGVIPISETIVGNMNLVTIMTTLIFLPAFAFLLARKFSTADIKIQFQNKTSEKELKAEGAEKMDQSKWPAYVFGAIVLLLAVTKAVQSEGTVLSFLSLNYINFLLFGLALMLHGSVNRFVKAAQEAISGATGILLQFPLYAGIMGIMSSSGLISIISQTMIEISSPFTFPLFTFLSAALVNVFVPSGGGQWIIQGPIIMEAARELGVPYSKTVMAMAYGDQVTNMLQPFWALPLLAITRLEAKDILPYTFLFFLSGVVIFTVVLILF